MLGSGKGAVVKRKQKNKQTKEPDYIADLPLHLLSFGSAVEKERDTCRKFIIDAMEKYDDAVYDAVIDATPKEVIVAMKVGRDAIVDQVDSILSVACSCAAEEIPSPSVENMLGNLDDREAGEFLGQFISDMHAGDQYALLSSLVHNLSRDAREQLEALT